MTTEEAREAAYERAVEVMAKALSPVGRINNPDGAYRRELARTALDALLAATQGDGAPLVLLGPEQVGLGIEHQGDVIDVMMDAPPGLKPLPGFTEIPLYRSQRETQS